MKFEELTKEYLLNNEKSLDTYAQNLGIIFREIEPGCAKATMDLKPSVVNPIGSIHGGALFSLADIVSGIAASAGGDKVTTLDSNIQYLAPAFIDKSKTLTAIAKARKSGKTIHVMEVEIFDDNERLIATAQFTFFVMR